MLHVILLGIFFLLNKAFTAFERAPSTFNKVIRTSVGDCLNMNAILTLINADLCKNASIVLSKIDENQCKQTLAILP